MPKYPAGIRRRDDPGEERETPLKISEIFYSVQGEGSRAGLPCVFIRLQGCGLRCVWCDTPYALDHSSGGTMRDAGSILEEVRRIPCPFVEFTGGEPLEQAECLPLMTRFCDEGYTVAVETGGHVDISSVDPRVIRIMDLKCPGSGMMKKNRYENIACLTRRDEVKFVIADETDYRWAAETAARYDLPSRCGEVLFSPVFGAAPSRDLAEWILRDRLRVRFQLQLHKYIWDPGRRGV